MLQIKNLLPNKAKLVADFYNTEDWKYSPSDICRYIQWEPNGCFAAEVDGTPVGYVFSISYDQLGWIGLLRVDPNYRNRGIGSKLMQKAISYLHNKGVKVIKLEAVQKAVDLYKRLGFATEFDSLRLRGVIHNVSTMRNFLKMRNHVEVRPMKNEDISLLAGFDASYFGASRIRVIEKLYREFPHLCFVAVADDKLIGYIMCRNSALNVYKMGPWINVPDKPEVAERLFVACLQKISENSIATLGTPKSNIQAIQIAKKFGFKLIETCKRMCLGQDQVKDNPEGIFGIGGSEKG